MLARNLTIKIVVGVGDAVQEVLLGLELLQQLMKIDLPFDKCLLFQVCFSCKLFF